MDLPTNWGADWGSEYIATFVLLIGAAFAMWGQKRKFDRTNRFGVEQFPSFWAKLAAKLKDGLLAFAAGACFAGGLLMLGLRYSDSWGLIILMPFGAFLLYILFWAM